MISSCSKPVTPSKNSQNLSSCLAVLLLPCVLVLNGCDAGKKEESGKDVKPAKVSYEPDPIFSVVDGYAENKYKPKKKRGPLKTFKDYLSASEEALKQKAYSDSANLAEAALKLNKNSGKAHYIRGKALSASATGDDDIALKEMNLAVALGFESADLYEYTAKIYDGKKDYPRAISSLTRAIRLDPHDRDNVRFRGALYNLIGDFERAEIDYTKNIQMSHENPNAYIDRGIMYEGNNQIEKALKDYDKAVFLAKKKTDAMTARARAYRMLGREDEALKDLNTIIESNPKDDDSIRTRGDIFAGRKQFKAAIRDYSKVIRNSPDQARLAYEARARAYDALGEKEKAESDRKSASVIKARPAEKTLFKIKRD